MEQANDWGREIVELMEKFRSHYVNKYSEYSGLDLNFDVLFCMKTGLSWDCFVELNNLALKRKNVEKEERK